MIKDKDMIDFAKKHPIFYMPTVLMGLTVLGLVVVDIAVWVDFWPVTIPLLLVGLVSILFSLVLAIILLIELAKPSKAKK